MLRPRHAGGDEGRRMSEDYDDEEADLAAVFTEEKPARPPAPWQTLRSKKPIIRVTKGKIYEAVDNACAVLANPGLGIYARGGTLVRAVEHKSTGGTLSIRKRSEGNVSRADGSTVVETVSEAALMEALTREAIFEKYSGTVKDWVSTDCPADVARMVLARRGFGWNIPLLRAIIHAPCLRENGSVISEPGYDDKTGLLFLSQRFWPSIPENPSRNDARAALTVLNEPIAEMPFVSDMDRAGAYALMMTAVLRPMLNSAPMFAVTAPAAGTGKSLLVDVASILATGHPAAVITPTRDEVELEKRLGAAALAGDSVITIDNVSHPLASDQLCQLLTQPEIQVRVLGKSENVKIPSTALICATGNNLSIVGDLVRRTILIRMDAKVERPDERDGFRFNPVDRALARRAELVVAALTIIRAYRLAGTPDRASPMGSFEDWSDHIRSALIWLGAGDARGNVDEMRAEDPEKATLAEIMRALPAIPFTVKDVRARCMVEPELREALALFIDRTGAFNATRFAGYLRRHRDRIVEGRAIQKVGDSAGHGATWGIEDR